MASTEAARELPRRLGLWSAAAVLVGSTVGSGIFRTPAVVAARVPDTWGFLAVWLVGGLVALAGALSLAELGAMIPRTGGLYAYLHRAYGERLAFLFGWAELIVLRPAAYGAIAWTSAEYAWRTLGLDGAREVGGLPVTGAQLSAAGLVGLVGLVNRRGIHAGARVQNVTTALKLGALLLLVGLGLAHLAPAGATPPARPVPSAAAGGLGAAAVAVLWSYDGWSDVGFVGGEVRDPERNLPRAFVLGTAVVVVTYLLVNVAYLSVIPVAAMPGSPLIAADVAEALLGPPGAVAVSAAVAVSTFGALNGSMMTGPRVFHAMAAHGALPRVLGRVHPRHGSPAAAIDLSVALGVLFVLGRTFAELADQFVVVIWPFYALSVWAVVVLRRQEPKTPRPYRTRGYPLVPALFVAAAVWMLLDFARAQPVVLAINAALVLAGLALWPLVLRARARAVAEPHD